MNKMADKRFGCLLLCFTIAWIVALGKADNYFADRDTKVNDTSMNVNEIRNITCVPAHPIPSSQANCKPYHYLRDKGVCSSIIGGRLVYGSIPHQINMEQLLVNFRMARAYVLSKHDISDRCLRTVELVYCNHYFKRCDDASSKILPVQVCREACDVMVQRHCKEEYRRAQEINQAVQVSPAARDQWAFDLIDCSTLPRRNGGTVPECYYPKEFEENKTMEGDFSDTCSYGDGQTYRGNVSVTRSGYTCQSWTSQCPHRHHRTPENFPELSNAGNACRNPGGQAPLGPWCYTTNTSVRWEYCNISTCTPEDATLSNWSPFTKCSVSCGSGWITRYRTCNRSRFGGKNCSSLGALFEQQPCNLQNCSVTVDNVDLTSEEKQPTGLTFTEIIMVSASGSVLFILSTILVVTLFKMHTGRKPNNPNIPDEEEITPYATVRYSEIFPVNAENNRLGFPGMFDNPLTTLPPSNKPKLRSLPYENLDHLGRPALNPLQYLFYQPHYENELVNNETGDVILIRPGYDKLTPATRKKRRENYSAQARRLECGKVDRNGLPVYDSLVREMSEISLKCKSRREDVADSESENERNIHTIMEVPSSDERSPASSMDRSGNAETSKQLSRKDSDVDVECGCIGNDWNTLDEQEKEQQLTFKKSNGNLSPRSQAAFKMEDKTGLFESYSSDLTQDTEYEQSPC